VGSILIALLGREAGPADGVRDYCRLLGQALELRGFRLELIHTPWAKLGWPRAFWWVWSRKPRWAGARVLLQYTAFSWSRSGLPLPFALTALLLRMRGAKLAVVYHDSLPHGARSIVGRLRTAAQVFAMRVTYRLSDLAVLTVPLDVASWLPDRRKAVTIPVGSNVAPLDSPPRRPRGSSDDPVVAVFGIDGGAHAATEVAQIAHAVGLARASSPRIRVVLFGTGTTEAEREIRTLLGGVPTDVLGVLEPQAAQEVLETAHATLFVRGAVASGRTTAVAAIAAGTPVVGFSGPVTGSPITEAGVRLVPGGRADLLGLALGEVLANAALWDELHRRNLEAMQRHFSWPAIAGRLLDLLGEQATSKKPDGPGSLSQ
jgi:glycosyltransferase involved in cell wall biosynthesis